MSAADLKPLFDAVGTDVTYYLRQLGARNSETGWPANTWSAGSTVKVVMTPLSKRNEGTPDTRGVTEQRWYVICQSKLEKDNLIKRGSEYYVIDTEAAAIQSGDEVLVYECEAIRELMV